MEECDDELDQRAGRKVRRDRALLRREVQGHPPVRHTPRKRTAEEGLDVRGLQDDAKGVEKDRDRGVQGGRGRGAGGRRRAALRAVQRKPPIWASTRRSLPAAQGPSSSTRPLLCLLAHTARSRTSTRWTHLQTTSRSSARSGCLCLLGGTRSRSLTFHCMASASRTDSRPSQQLGRLSSRPRTRSGSKVSSGLSGGRSTRSQMTVGRPDWSQPKDMSRCTSESAAILPPFHNPED